MYNNRESSKKARLRGETIEARILMSVTWFDADSGSLSDSADDGNNIFLGTSSAEIVDGLDGDDTLISGGGDDTLSGAGGADVFRVTGVQAGDWLNVDGGEGQDTIDLSNYDSSAITDSGR